MKTYNEMADEVFRIGDERIRYKKKNRAKAVISVVVVAVVAVSAVTFKNALKPANKLINEPEILFEKNVSTDVSDGCLFPDEVTTAENKKDTVTAYSKPYNPEKSDRYWDGNEANSNDRTSYGSSSQFFIPAFPQKNGIKYTGEKITDEEARRYFENNSSIKSSLIASGIDAGNMRISERGYSLISYMGVVDENFELKQNFRNYFVYNGDRIVAIITLYKENGKLYDSPAFGGEWFNYLTDLFAEYKGKEIVFLLAGNAEFAITSDGKIHSYLGYDSKSYFEGVDNLYEKIYCPEAVYVP